MLDTRKTLQKFLEKHRGQKSLVVILGPTASGKTRLSLELAKEFHGEIISADSRQIYRGMDIGTDKIPLEKQEGILHYLIDVVDPHERFTVTDFKRLAEEKIEEILERGHVPFLVGGTGLYLRAVTENFQIPETGNDLSVRQKFESEARKKAEKIMNAEGVAEETAEEKISHLLHEELTKVDPESAAKIHPKNIRYILRALEIFSLTGKPKRDQRGKPKYAVLKIGLRVALPLLDERIHQRIDDQFKRGLVEEVCSLLAQGYDEKTSALQTFGYQELIPALRGNITLEEAKEHIKKHTRQFSRRQITWFKKEPEVQWHNLTTT